MENSYGRSEGNTWRKRMVEAEDTHEGGINAWRRWRRCTEKTHGGGEGGTWRRCMVEVKVMHGKDVW